MKVILNAFLLEIEIQNSLFDWKSGSKNLDMSKARKSSSHIDKIVELPLDLDRARSIYFSNFRTCSCFLPFIFNAYTDQTLNLLRAPSSSLEHSIRDPRAILTRRRQNYIDTSVNQCQYYWLLLQVFLVSVHVNTSVVIYPNSIQKYNYVQVVIEAFVVFLPHRHILYVNCRFLEDMSSKCVCIWAWQYSARALVSPSFIPKIRP